MARKAALGALLVGAIALAVLLRGFSAAPLPAPAPFAGPLPPATPPAEMEIAALATGVTHRSAAFGYRGGSFRDRRAFAMAALLVQHPRGDLVWQREGIALREERPWLMRALADRDPAGVRENILRMAALAARFPELEIVPTHDARAFAALPGL